MGEASDDELRMIQALIDRDPYALELVEDDDLQALGRAFLAGEELPVVDKALRTRLGLLAVQARMDPPSHEL